MTRSASPETRPHVSKNLKMKPFGGARAIQDPSVVEFINATLSQTTISKVLNDTSVVDIFVKNFRNWFLSSSMNRISGLDLFPIGCFCQGTTQTFDLFYAKYKDRRFRCFRGEYAYHKLSCRNHFPGQFKFLDEDELEPGDAVIMSAPFADSGEVHPKMALVLDDCDKKKLPVLMDLSYASLANSFHIDLNRDCIEVVTTSLSKVFPVAHLRIGLRWTRVDDDDPLLFLKKTGYQNRLSAFIGNELIKNFPPDYILKKYKTSQEAVCNELGVEPSPTVFFGLGDQKWSEYSRAGLWNRLFLGGAFESLVNK